MADRTEQQDFVNHVVDLLQSLGPVTARRMFGGHGVFLDGLMFALIANNELYFKADEESRAQFTEQGLRPFSYNKQGKVMSLSYYQAPEETLEDMLEMANWGNLGFACALRAAAAKTSKARQSGKSRKNRKGKPA